MIQKLNENFPNWVIQSPLFYSWPIGIRFEIGSPDIGVWKDSEREALNDEYFEKALQRSIAIFDFIFEDEFSIIHQDYSDHRRKIRKSDVVMKQIDESLHRKLRFRKVKSSQFEFKKEHWNQFELDTTVDKVNFTEILKQIIMSDFGGDYRGQTFFINKSKTIILYLYDDRGMDVISNSVNDLRELYTKFNSWILDYDREVIDEVFTN